jgi:hypothetical protein
MTTTNHAPASPKPPPTHDFLLAELFAINGDIDTLIETHALTPDQFLAFAKDDKVREALDAWELMQERHQRILARQCQADAAIYLRQSSADTTNPVEIRRAATILARLSALMLAPPRRRKPTPSPHEPIAPNTPTPPPTDPAPLPKPAKPLTAPQANALLDKLRDIEPKPSRAAAPSPPPSPASPRLTSAEPPS